MSEDEGRKATGHEEEQDEVESHRAVKAANEEAGDETDSDDDVEGHLRRTT
jgi:hypothetical protein